MNTTGDYPHSAIILMGPTATGKTGLALELVRRFPLEIISVDSALVYRGMNIGTAKPCPEVLAEAPHRLIDILDPEESYSAARFRADALEEMRSIRADGKVPLLVGGTMLYFRALEEGLSALPPANAAVREAIEQEAASHGWAALHEQLQRIDPVAAARIHPNDPQRIQRALEVYRLTGLPLSELQYRRKEQTQPFEALRLALVPADREKLSKRIFTRFVNMLQEGLIEEVERLYKRPGLDLSFPSMRAVGYRQVWRYLAGEIERDEMVVQAITATRQLAKRQMTWLRRDQACERWEADNLKLSKIYASVANYLETSC